MRHLDLFAGIGGFSLAASWMGWETVAQVEWDKWCQKVLAKNFPDALRFGDIVEFNKMLQNGKIITDTKDNRDKRNTGTMEQEATATKCEDDGAIINGIGKNGLTSIGRIDIITGGFPCQPFSHAGKRKGVDDSRYLWPEMLTTIRIFKPSFVVGENVAGLVSMENGKTLERILSDLENEGYQTESFIIPACAVGAWHRRDRIWIIGHRYSANNEGIGLCCQAENGELERRFGPAEHHKRNGKSVYNMWDAEPSVGRVANGLPYWVDGYWDREPEGIPRVATGVKNRVDRLKGLGNAIVPQVVFEVFKAIENVDKY